jgi:hypothetical protein
LPSSCQPVVPCRPPHRAISRSVLLILSGRLPISMRIHLLHPAGPNLRRPVRTLRRPSFFQAEGRPPNPIRPSLSATIPGRPFPTWSMYAACDEAGRRRPSFGRPVAPTAAPARPEQQAACHLRQLSAPSDPRLTAHQRRQARPTASVPAADHAGADPSQTALIERIAGSV